MSNFTLILAQKRLFEEWIKSFVKGRLYQLSGVLFYSLKMRLRSSDLPKGKNKSFRVIILLLEIENALVPLTIYAKSERSTISKQEILNHIKSVRQEM